MRIGFFDSGIGGITVLNEALKILPYEEYLYYADTLNVPYGSKDKAQVKNYIFEAVDFIFQSNIDILVIACNTATSIAIKDLRKKYKIPIIGMEPALKPALEKCGNKRVLVSATPLTLAEDKYENLVSKLNADNIVDSVALPELVELAENYEFDEKVIKPYLLEKLSGYNIDLYGTFVLGCTHFIYYKKIFSDILPKNMDIIDGNRGTVNHMLSFLKKDNDKYFRSKRSLSGDYKYNIDFYTSSKAADSQLFYKYFNVL